MLTKNLVLLLVFALAFFTAGGNSRAASAQEEKRLDSSPAAFRAFFSKFRAAIEKSDKTAVAAATQFPFKYGFDAGDEGTMTRAQFLKRFNEVFGDEPKQFLTEKNPLFSRGDGGSYVVSTEDAAHLIFVRRGNNFKFAAYLVEP